MSVFDATYTFLAGTTVSEKNKTIAVDGIRTALFSLDLQNKWKTSAIATHFFKKMRRLSLELNAFFAPDFYYIVKTLIDDRRTRSNRNMLRSIATGLANNTWLKGALSDKFTSRLDYSALERLNVTLLPHQMEFLKTYDENTARWRLNGFILGAAPGSGKTITNLALAECLNSEVVICVVPKNSVDTVWGDTLSWLFKQSQPYWVSTSEDQLTANYKYYVAHYEQLERLVEFFRENHKGRKVTVILDESHNLNDIKSARSNLFNELCKLVKSTDVVWSSGTPLKAMGSEVIPILRTIDPFFGPEEEDRFKRVFGLSTARALDILAHRLGYMTFKVNKDQIVGNTVRRYRIDVKIPNGREYTLAHIKDEMAKFVRERIAFYQKNMDSYIEMYMHGLAYYEETLTTRQEKEGFAEYKRMASAMHRGYDPYVHKTEPVLCNTYEKKLIIPRLPKGMKEEFIDARSVYKYMSLKVQGEALGRILGRKRTQCSLDMLAAWKDYKVTDLQTHDKYDSSLVEIVDNSTNKTVIFTSYVEVVDGVAKIFKDAGAKPLKVYGETNRDLPQIVSVFDKDKSANPLAATLQSLSTAVPLVMANTVVFLNAPFRIHEYEQACSRVDRLGQKETVHIFDVFLDTGEDANISTRSLDIMAWSRSMVEAMLGKPGSSSVALESFDDCYAPEELREDLEGSTWVSEPVRGNVSPKLALETLSW